MPVSTMATLGCSTVKVGVSVPRVAAPTPGMGLLRDGCSQVAAAPNYH